MFYQHEKSEPIFKNFRTNIQTRTQTLSYSTAHTADKLRPSAGLSAGQVRLIGPDNPRSYRALTPQKKEKAPTQEQHLGVGASKGMR